MSAKAAVVHEDRILLVEYRCPGDTGHFSLPGGRPVPGEGAEAAALRKVAEETCLDVVSQGLLAIVEYLPDRHDRVHGPLPRLQLVFRCTPAPGRTATDARMPARPEPGHAAVTWLPLVRIPRVTLQPAVGPHLLRALTAAPTGPSAVPLVREERP
ncbi:MULTISPECIES: NUDIX domain-containing protein [unclassified Streptomyces]|uniref:NUDIX domain-containing protein n=1 Tax=unclassified Streptomyces TaxID=2593676 RepID=UPI0004C0ED1D|nr:MULTISPECIES: NUDIX domain-containing protein [unclassified Streptomyces]